MSVELPKDTLRLMQEYVCILILNFSLKTVNCTKL